MMDYYKLIYNYDISFKGHAFMSDYDSLYITNKQRSPKN